MSKICIENGVDILSPACGIGVRTKLENMVTLLDTAKSYKIEEVLYE